MPAPELIRAFLSQATASGARSTALQPLGWLAAILTLGLALASKYGAPAWSVVLLGILLGLSVALYLGSYVYFAVKDPDALRSERFTLSKMALEKNLIGDSTAGLLEIEEPERLSRVAALPKSKAEGAQ